MTRTADGRVPAVAVGMFSGAATAILTAVAAASSNSTAAAKKYFATGEVAFDPRIYALAQCAPVLTPAQCRGCLGQLLAQIKVKLSKSNPIWVASRAQWCDLRYSVPPLYQGQSMLQLEAPPTPPSETTGAAGTLSRFWLCPKNYCPISNLMHACLVCREEEKEQCSRDLCGHRLLPCITIDCFGSFVHSLQEKD